MEQHLNEFHARGIEIAAISVDSPEASRKLIQSRGFHYPILSDPKAEAIRSYGVLHPKAGENGQDIARPAEFLVDSKGTIVWENLTEDLRVRARPGIILEAIDRLLGKEGR
jgi:peroxiredoxin